MKIKIIKFTFIMTLFLEIIPSYSQNKNVSTFNSYELCFIENMQPTDCKTINSSPLITKIEIIPNKEITIIMNGETYTQNWDRTSLSINNNNLFLYKLIKGNMNKKGDLDVTVIMYQDYKLYCIRTFLNVNNQIIMQTSNGN
ncbi:hypothetical protein H0I59_09895 [Flavobacterium psychrophilum]|uniref:Uncharacterized protein n=1 Tax=Flavobacterium psychrophilum TaxID=96345 RepID=A0A7U2RBV7_FLAPS|nr:hypothetical protein [Flavobacterium psychrophilum]MBF1998681.1 hypothetical protein [Flavobacterium psychrophilum]MBF2082575.1 hypothetical protein [Flavobacterium psychrophilum]MCB5981820.1 hypothetical protein [Flavobacterium psychrophilum]MCB6002948.1 hypothetical protein [Flavobacterium psychrophilum]MCB6012677.1 hypothetical protein [Flavobacterium psychrophilum]